MNHTRTNLYTIIFITVILLILAAMSTTPAAAQAAVESPEGGRNFASLTASHAADTGHGADTPNPDTDTPTPGPVDPEPEPDLNPCGEYAEDGPHPCNDHTDPTPPQDGERRQQ